MGKVTMTRALAFKLLTFGRIGERASEFKTKRPRGEVGSIQISLVILS